MKTKENEHRAELPSPVLFFLFFSFWNYFQPPAPSWQLAKILNITSHQVGQMSSRGATPFEKAQLTVIRLAEKSAALRHEPVGKYFYASLKRRPLTGWERARLLGKEKLAMSCACFGPACLFSLSGAGGAPDLFFQSLFFIYWLRLAKRSQPNENTFCLKWSAPNILFHSLRATIYGICRNEIEMRSI